MRAVWAALLVRLLTCGPACRSSSSTSSKGDENQGKPATTKPQDLIVGTWESTDERDKRTLEFGKDGLLAIKQEGQPEMRGTYTFTGEEALELEFTRPLGERVKAAMTAKVSADELMLTDPDMKVHRFRRRN
jgi:uncharacterized protein (TIGR03066 family)